MSKKTAVGADFPEDLPSENIKQVIFREDGSIEKIEYYDPIDRSKPCVHRCNCNHWRSPYYDQPWVTYTTDSSGTYSIGSSDSTTTWS